MSTTAIAAGLASAMMIIAFAAAADETAAPDTKPAHAENPWTPLFNGKDLAGWQVKCRPADKDKMFWFVRDGAIVCDSMKDGDHHYVWLMTKAEYGDFELRLKVRGHAPKSGMVAKSTSASGVGESVAGKDAEAGDARASSIQADAASDDRSQHGAEKTSDNRSNWTERPKDLFTRYWGRAVIDAPGGRLVVHGMHGYHAKADIRLRELDEVLPVIKKDVAAGVSVVLLGDLNHEPDSEEYGRIAAAKMTDSFGGPATGPEQLTIPSTGRKKRIDYIWSAGPISKRLRSARVLFEGAFRTNPQDPNSFALSDHVPVLAVFAMP